MSARRPPDPLLDVFGPKTSLARGSVAAFCNALQQSFAERPSSPAARLFEGWRAPFGLRHAVAARKVEPRRARIDAWRRGWLGGPDGDEDVFLFAVQSYCATALKLAAARRLSVLASDGSADPTEFWQRLESGDQFRQAQVSNLVYGDAFQAVTVGEVQARAPLAAMTDAARHMPSANASSIRAFHVALLPRPVRHALGEYDTPEWLASHVLDAVSATGACIGRVLDPMCGGGVFLTSVLQRRAGDARAPQEQLASIAGIEIHPLAVLAARVAVLGTVIGRLGENRLETPVTLPVFQGDAILATVQRREPGQTLLRVTTPMGVLLVEDNEHAVSTVGGALGTAGVHGCAEALVANARGLRDLPAFDAIVGNPPWVGWETLPAEYRRETVPLWNAYGLFAQRGMDAILGGGKKDLSMLATYAAAGAWLRPGGILGFVLSESAFKAVGAARGFRRFQLGSGEALGVVQVDDLTRLNPFANAATRSTVVVLQKGRPTSYPVSVVQWRRSSRRQAFAAPTDAVDLQSPWLTASREALPLLRRMLGPSTVRAYEGVNTGGANGIYWLRVIERTGNGNLIVENVPERGRAAVARIRAEIEPTFVFPLLRHGDVSRWRAASSMSVLLLQDPVKRRGIDAAELAARAPQTWTYIQRFESILRRRAAFDRYFRKRNGDAAPFYSMFNVGPYTLAPIKVVWKRMIAPLEAAVVAADAVTPILPQETLCFIPCESGDAAHFYTGLVNSTAFSAASLCVSQGSSKSFGAPHLLELVRLPTYEPSSSVHRSLVEAAKAAEGDSTVENEVNRAAADVFGLVAAEATVLANERDFLLSR